jgi:hypothetical protein
MTQRLFILKVMNTMRSLNINHMFMELVANMVMGMNPRNQVLHTHTTISMTMNTNMTMVTNM